MWQGQVRKAKRKGIEAQMAKHPIPTWATDAVIGDEEKEKK